LRYNIHVDNKIMLTKRFQFIFILSIFLNWLHGVECTLTKYYEVGPIFFNYFHTLPETAYFSFHITLYIFLILAYFLLKGGTWIFIPLILYGTVFITEFHHFIRGITTLSYYPGMITSFFFPFLGIFYWMALVRLWGKIR